MRGAIILRAHEERSIEERYEEPSNEAQQQYSERHEERPNYARSRVTRRSNNTRRFAFESATMSEAPRGNNTRRFALRHQQYSMLRAS